ncbi:carboxylic ester hydrolase [Elysia marginata]|uniref:Carboxylic ester hydrolase n=1 Tax=Elysia marginata TaxID=1093978 RepID=A0AAV4IRL3_9GAST|nr:carboxylic ester hydrolase [Elysia marginata]
MFLSGALTNVKTLLFYLWLCSDIIGGAKGSVVQTPVGKVVGSLVQKDSLAFLVYKSIPFAKPPIGDLRFKRPQPLSGTVSNQTINSEDYKKSCWSATKTSPHKYYGEDCLYLNVYAPEGNGPFPVMVWIHGGGFVAGSTFPEPLKMVHQGKVIVVSINYRLGIFGFMTTEDNAFPSNNGLWDQYMAIKWVYENIEHFNGDPNSITLFGESAGATSAALHVISPISSKYFHKVILQSGGMTSMLSRTPETPLNKFAELVGCNTISGSRNNSCLQNLDVSSILTYSKPEWYVSNSAQKQIDFVWLPVIDGEFILDEPLNLLNNVTYLEQQGAFEKDFMIGVLNDEGALLTTNFFYPIPVTNLEDSNFLRDLENFLLPSRYGSNVEISQAAINAINTFYTGNATLNSPPTATSVLDFGGDVYLVVPAMEAALALTQMAAIGAAKSKTFFYHFDFCPAKTELEAPCFAHGDELPLQFPKKNITDPVKAKLSDMFISLLTSFARSSDPGIAVSCGWPQFEPQGRKYLRISPTPDVRSHLYQYRMQFWLETMPNILG